MSEFIQEARRASWLEPHIHEEPQDNLWRSSPKEVKSIVTEIQDKDYTTPL